MRFVTFWIQKPAHYWVAKPDVGKKLGQKFNLKVEYHIGMAPYLFWKECMKAIVTANIIQKTTYR